VREISGASGRTLKNVQFCLKPRTIPQDSGIGQKGAFFKGITGLRFEEEKYYD